MTKRGLMALVVVAAFAVNAQAAIRTIEIDYQGGVSTGWFVDVLGGGVGTVDDSTGLGLDIFHEEYNGGNSTFSSTGLSATFNAGIEFSNVDGEMVRLLLTMPTTGPSDLSGVADGVYTATVQNLTGTGNSNGVEVTLGTAAVPEPSAFAFGALALALTGFRRWGRNWFGKASA